MERLRDDMSRFPYIIAGVILGGFGLLGTTLVAFTHDATRARITENQRVVFERQLHELISPGSFDNNVMGDVINISEPAALNAKTTRVYRATKEGRPVAAIFSPVKARGYAGPIRLIVAVRLDGTLAGVRVLSHKETPGLGDKIDLAHSDWVLGFTDRSLANPGSEAWKVRKDGGAFDQFTGATITARGVTRAILAVLQYFEANRDKLFANAGPDEYLHSPTTG
jgi:electron transport complex protein RnfG